MSRPIIEVRNVSKRYVLGQIGATSFRDEAERLIGRLTGKTAKQEENEYWALRDVSFDVQPGEVVGLIGRNGAGKSTMLKILSRITEPTTGEIRIRGRIASLLEVGTGFHPELSGRENIFLNGAILGMKKAEIARKFDEIVAFSEIEKFLDTPVKRYSSGMYVRLAFAIAAHLEPEILIVDEVLAVGDAQFQEKCLGKMKDVCKGGRTILFVSHNLGAVRALCTKCVYLRGGQLLKTGATEEVLTDFLGIHNDAGGIVKIDANERGNGALGLLEARVVQNGNTTPRPTLGQPIDLEFLCEAKDADFVSFPNIHLYTVTGECVFSSVAWPGAMNADSVWPEKPLGTGRFTVRCRIPPGLLNEGRYMVNFLFIGKKAELHAQYHHLMNLEIQDDGAMRRAGFDGQWIGVTRPTLTWKYEPKS